MRPELVYLGADGVAAECEDRGEPRDGVCFQGKAQVPHLISSPPVPANSLLPRPLVPVDGLPAGNDGGTPSGSSQPADHPRDGRQLLHRPWTARNGRHLPQGPKDQVTPKKVFSSHSTGTGWLPLPMRLLCLPARARQR